MVPYNSAMSQDFFASPFALIVRQDPLLIMAGSTLVLSSWNIPVTSGRNKNPWMEESGYFIYSGNQQTSFFGYRLLQ